MRTRDNGTATRIGGALEEMSSQEILGEEAEEQSPGDTLWKKALKKVSGFVGGCATGVLIAVIASFTIKAIDNWWPLPAIKITSPDGRNHVPAKPCLLISGHGLPDDGQTLLVYASQTNGGAKIGKILFVADVHSDGEEWYVNIPLRGREGAWYQIRVASMNTEQARYYARIANDPSGRAMWEDNSVPPGAHRADTVEVQRDKGPDPDPQSC
ncbi:hypothetical protein [Streptosporangium sp. NPDC023615]|uniref:hypothetical protein n=1 Tax=Streptosporangium sp. NPDC023615 TaxID=3154794 RepID=UPI0034310A98